MVGVVSSSPLTFLELILLYISRTHLVKLIQIGILSKSCAVTLVEAQLGNLFKEVSLK